MHSHNPSETSVLESWMIRKDHVRFGGGTVEKYHPSMLRHGGWQLATFLPYLSKETNKGKLRGSLQGYHNGAVPWGYISTLQGNRKVGVPDPEKAKVVVEMFERYATGKYSDMQITEWLNTKGLSHQSQGIPSAKIPCAICCVIAYFVGQNSLSGHECVPKGSAFVQHLRK